MTFPLETFIFGLTSKTLSIANKRHDLEHLLGILAEIAILSLARPASCQRSEVTSPHTVSTLNPLILVERCPQAVKLGCGELTVKNSFFQTCTSTDLAKAFQNSLN